MTETTGHGETATADHGPHPSEREPSEDAQWNLRLADYYLRAARRHTRSLDTRECIDDARTWVEHAETAEEVTEGGE